MPVISDLLIPFFEITDNVASRLASFVHFTRETAALAVPYNTIKIGSEMTAGFACVYKKYRF